MSIEYLDNNKINIPGLEYIQNYISEKGEATFINHIDLSQWNLDLKRRTQHYGYKYDYSAKSVDKSLYLGEMPEFLDEICKQLYTNGIFKQKPDQVIINEYLPGQGISSHIDCEKCFGETICSLSLNSGCIMNFTGTRINANSIYLERRSLLILKDEARYKYKHGIQGRKTDNGITRGRRISLTFRKLLV